MFTNNLLEKMFAVDLPAIMFISFIMEDLFCGICQADNYPGTSFNSSCYLPKCFALSSIDSYCNGSLDIYDHLDHGHLCH